MPRPRLRSASNSATTGMPSGAANGPRVEYTSGATSQSFPPVGVSLANHRRVGAEPTPTKATSVSRAARRPVLDEPVIILTSARSGSTLLRLILDAHPDLACPPETNIVKTCRQLANAFSTINDEGQGVPKSQRSGQPIDAAIATLFRDYLAERNKLRWCDKSLGTASVASWFAELYPKAQFICLYRHCMDVMASGLEASPWGLVGYGFDEFAVLSSGNSLSALAAYWTEHTGRILEFERLNEARCIRVYYEKLVEDPDAVASEIFSFLGVAPAAGVSARCLGLQDRIAGPGDHKIGATRKITADSVGRGVRIPVGMIPGPQLQVMNHLLGELGYALVNEAWRKSPYPLELLQGNGHVSTDMAASGDPVSFADGFARSALVSIGEVLRARVHAAFGRMEPPGQAGKLPSCRCFVLVAYHWSEARMASAWRVDLEDHEITQLAVTNADLYAADWLVTGDVETWLAVLADRANMATCIRHGQLRYIELGHDEAESAPGPQENIAASARMEARISVVRQFLGISRYPEEVSPL